MSTASRLPIRLPSLDLWTVVSLSTINRETLCRPFDGLGVIGSLNRGASVSSVVNTQTVIDVGDVETIILYDNGRAGLAGVAGAGHGPDFTAGHADPRSEIASMKA